MVAITTGQMVIMNCVDQRFQQAFRKFGHLEFKYGDIDCVTFVALVLQEVTGTDYMAKFHYESKAQADAIIRENGGFLNLIERVLGPCVGSPEHCGPVVCRDAKNGFFMGIHINNLVVCKTKYGLNQVPASKIERSWKCPA